MDWLQQILGTLLNAILSVLPDSPFSGYIASTLATFSPYLGYINWVCDFGLIVTIATGWIAAVGIYYVVMVILRWIKAVEG